MLNRQEIERLISLLNEELKREDIRGELYLVGGAVMCLGFAVRASTKDIDAYFVPATKIRQAAARIALEEGLDDDWLNDGVKGFLSAKGEFEPFLELSNIAVFCATAEYMLAMKCLAMRIGEEFQDVSLEATFSGISMRQMADEAAMLDVYNLVYQPTSGVVHGEWWAIEDYAMQRCANGSPAREPVCAKTCSNAPAYGNSAPAAAIRFPRSQLNKMRVCVSATDPRWRPSRTC